VGKWSREEEERERQQREEYEREEYERYQYQAYQYMMQGNQGPSGVQGPDGVTSPRAADVETPEVGTCYSQKMVHDEAWGKPCGRKRGHHGNHSWEGGCPEDCDLCIIDVIIGDVTPDPMDKLAESDELWDVTMQKVVGMMAGAISDPLAFDKMLGLFYPDRKPKTITNPVWDEMQKAGKLTIGDLIDYDYDPRTDAHHYNPKGPKTEGGNK
jgi:hypothetical protein